MKIIILLTLLIFTGCSSLKRQQIYTGLAGVLIGGAIGSVAGKAMAPRKADQRYNQLLAGTIGSAVGGMAGVGLGSIFWKDNPENTPLNNMILKDLPKNSQVQKEKIKLVRPKQIERIPLKSEVPTWLKGKVKEGQVIVYEISEYEEEDENGRIIYHEPHKAYEYVIE